MNQLVLSENWLLITKLLQLLQKDKQFKNLPSLSKNGNCHGLGMYLGFLLTVYPPLDAEEKFFASYKSICTENPYYLALSIKNSNNFSKMENIFSFITYVSSFQEKQSILPASAYLAAEKTAPKHNFIMQKIIGLYAAFGFDPKLSLPEDILQARRSNFFRIGKNAGLMSNTHNYFSPKKAGDIAKKLQELDLKSGESCMIGLYDGLVPHAIFLYRTDEESWKVFDCNDSDCDHEGIPVFASKDINAIESYIVKRVEAKFFSSSGLCALVLATQALLEEWLNADHVSFPVPNLDIYYSAIKQSSQSDEEIEGSLFPCI